MLGHPPIMAQATVGVEALPPDPPDPPISTREDFPPLSNTSKSITNSNDNMKTFTNDNYTRYLEVDFGKTDRR